MESWRKVFRAAVPMLSLAGLDALEAALETKALDLIQGQTCSPPPQICVATWSVEGACGLAYPGWKGDGLRTVAEVEVRFAAICFLIDADLHEPDACRWFLNWFDSTPMDEVRRLLLPEVKRAIAARTSVAEG